MIALDSSVLVRYLVEDDVRQTALASALIKRAIDRDSLRPSRDRLPRRYHALGSALDKVASGSYLK